MDYSEVVEEDGYDGLDIPRPRDGWVYDLDDNWVHCERRAWVNDEPPLEELPEHLVRLYNEYLCEFETNKDDFSGWAQAWSDYECELLEWVEERAESMVTA